MKKLLLVLITCGVVFASGIDRWALVYWKGKVAHLYQLSLHDVVHTDAELFIGTKAQCDSVTAKLKLIPLPDAE